MADLLLDSCLVIALFLGSAALLWCLAFLVSWREADLSLGKCLWLAVALDLALVLLWTGGPYDSGRFRSPKPSAGSCCVTGGF